MPTYSHSRLETYENCPRQYKLHYIDKVEVEERESVEAFLGSKVHETLEKLYRDVRMMKLPTPEEVLSHFDRLWDRDWNDGIKIVRTEYTKDNYKELGHRCIRDYYEQHHPFDEARTISLEHMVFFPIDEAKEYWLRGVIDRLSIAKDGTYEIHDYKTSSRLPSQAQVDKDRQLALYHIAVQGMWPDIRNIELVWHYLAFGKELRSRRTPEELEGLKGQVLDLIHKIERDEEFTPKESPLCDWCVYPEYCPAKRHSMLTENLTANEYLKEPGVKLVNRFAELDGQKREVEAEITRVKDALIHYARKNNVQAVKGSGHRVLVRFYRGLAFPGRDDPARRKLEDLVKDLGLWDRVAVLSPVSLAKLVEGGELDPEAAGKISRMGKEEERPWVKLSTFRRQDDGL
jgi:putative RecB family exonuclease